MTFAPKHNPFIIYLISSLFRNTRSLALARRKTVLFKGKRIIVVVLISVETDNLVRLFGVTLSLVATQRSRASELLWVVMYVLSGRNCFLFGLSIVGLITKHAETFYFSFDCAKNQIFTLYVAKHWSAVPRALWTGREASRKHRWRQTHTNPNLRKSLFWEISQTKRVSQPWKERTFARRTETYIAPRH